MRGGIVRRLNIEYVKEFVKENSNCFLLSDEYINVDTKMRFKCACGSEFETSFYKFNKRNKRQCNECGKYKAANAQKLSYEEVKEFIEVDSNSGCKLLSETYDNAHEKLKIECECGNCFETKFNHFKSSFQRQCPTCGYEKTASSKRLSKSYVKGFIESKKCKLISDYKNINTMIVIECECGKHFRTLFPMFRDFDIQSCSLCRQKEKSTSKGETKIEEWLINNQIPYKTQYTFDGLKHSKPLKFDFAILNSRNNVRMLIEYDGKQHFGLGLFSNDEEKMLESYNNIKQSDYSKNEYCFRNGIPLMRIPYNRYYKIEEILESVLL